ncbi:MAG: FKBP-type peptidyl-prolyl cis-trans isomerase [Crocinitomicaceae bacterium]
MRLINLTLIAIVFLSSCSGESNDTNENGESNGIVANDTTSANERIDSTVTDEPFSLLKDTINGQVNEMVYQREDGLRIEWKRKKEDPILPDEVVMVNYEARIAGGKVYDSNSELGEPVPLKTNIGMMVPGFEQGLLKMNIGDKGRIMIPMALGYGETGYPGLVPPEADLIIEIEIVERIEPIVLEEGVKVYRWKANNQGVLPEKGQTITFDYFAYQKGDKPGLYDNSFQNSQPFSFEYQNDNVVDGLHQGMSVLKQAENAFIEIPAPLAYGSKGLVDRVPKNTDIVYDVRISSID